MYYLYTAGVANALMYYLYTAGVAALSHFYNGLNLNQDKATKPQTVQIVRQGEATLYRFKVNPLYFNPL